MQIRPLRPFLSHPGKATDCLARADSRAHLPVDTLIYAGVAQKERHNVENVASAGARPAAGTNFRGVV